MTNQGYHADINAGFMCATELTGEAGASMKEGPASIIVRSQTEETGKATELPHALMHLQPGPDDQPVSSNDGQVAR